MLTPIILTLLALSGLGLANSPGKPHGERAYQPGWCGAHIVKSVHKCDQLKNKPCDFQYGFNWGVNVTLFSDRQKAIGSNYVFPVSGKTDTTFSVPSGLRYNFQYRVINGAYPDEISYTGWLGKVEKPLCAIGPEVNGFTSIDCGFSCGQK